MSDSDIELHQSTPLGAFALLAKHAVGAGILAIPKAFEGTGYVGGLTMLPCIAAVMFSALYVLQEATVRSTTRAFNYQAVIEEYLGERAALLAEVGLFVHQLLTCCVFLVIIGDAFAPVLTRVVSSPNAAHLIALLVFSLPSLLISFYERVSQLACFMWLGVAILTVIVVLIVGHYAEHGASPDFEPATAWPPGLLSRSAEVTNFVASVPIFVFSLHCENLAPRIVAELEPASQKLHWLVGAAACTFAVTLYCAVGYAGYREFGGGTQGNIVLNYNHLSAPVMYLTGGQAILGYALNHFPCRAALYSLMVRCWAATTPTEGAVESQPLLQKRHEPVIPRAQSIAITCSLYLLMLPPAYYFDLDELVALIGGTLGTLLIFVFPALIAWHERISIPSVTVALLLSGFVCLSAQMVRLFARTGHSGP